LRDSFLGRNLIGSHKVLTAGSRIVQVQILLAVNCMGSK
jgi:hypothetical protein